MGWLVKILTRRAISYALVREVRRRILGVLKMALARRAEMVEADLILLDFERMLGPVLIGAGGHGVVHIVPALS